MEVIEITDVLKEAKGYQKQKRWHEAIKYYKQYMEEQEQCSDTVYISYAKCLRMVGKMSQAKEILKKGKAQYPESENIYKEYFTLYDYLGDWQAQKEVAETLVRINPNRPDHYFKLGMAFSSLKNKQEAAKSYKIGLTKRHSVSFDELVRIIQKGFTDEPSEVNSKYIYINGKNNLGAFIHEYMDKKYITKISIVKRGTKRERAFYRGIYSSFPEVRNIAPNYVDSKVIDNIQYLTLEMIESSNMNETEEQAIQAAQQFTTITYRDIIDNYPNPNYLFSFRSRPISVVIFFTQIHKKYYNESLLTAFKIFTQQKGFNVQAIEIIKELEDIILNNHLYALINPDKHYSLLHGDYIPKNMKIDNVNSSLYIFDWATFTTGPRFIDVARYLSATNTPYENVKRKYLFNENVNGNLTSIEQIFFLYAFILFHFIVMKKKNQNKKIMQFIFPALEDLKKVLLQLKKQNINIIQLAKEKSKLLAETDVKISEWALENNRLKKKILDLNQEQKRIETMFNDSQLKLNNIYNSRFWKVTAPIRRFLAKRS